MADPLTHLPNRRLLIDRLKQALIGSTRNHRSGALLFMDLDKFKTLNDTLGHEMGDLLLQKVAKRLALSVRESDTVARIGGDEFVLLIEDLDEDGVKAAAQIEIIATKILSLLAQAYELGSYEYLISGSIGATLFNGHEKSAEELLKQADIAMYEAKGDGRNRLRFFDPLMQESINVHAAMERELRNAITQQQFQLYYQPQVNDLGECLGAEALLRWIHPERGAILPIEFIQLAEESGLILPIGLWVLETACAQLKEWEKDPMTHDLTISINISAREFNQPTFVRQVETTLQRSAINPNLLKLKLTESIIMEHINQNIIAINELRVLGLHFVLDDFGTGYASLQYLKKIPFSQLKIDQSFVRNIVTDSDDRVFLQTIILMAKSLGLKVIAEGVETEQQRQILLDNGCKLYQGYLFGSPMSIDNFETKLRDR